MLTEHRPQPNASIIDNPVNPDFWLRTPGSGRWSGSSPKLNSLVPGPCPTPPRNLCNFFSYPTDRQTDRQTDRGNNYGDNANDKMCRVDRRVCLSGTTSTKERRVYLKLLSTQPRKAPSPLSVRQELSVCLRVRQFLKLIGSPFWSRKGSPIATNVVLRLLVLLVAITIFSQP